MSAPARMVPFVDGIAVQLWLMRNPLAELRESLGLSEVKAFEDLPDELANYVPVVKLSRTGGAADNPRFTSQYWMSYNVWSAAEESKGWDPHRAAFELARQVARVLYEAWENQTVTPYGCINKWRESTGFRKFDDAELPHISRQVAVYDLMIKNPRV
jgi:hypothetical protein